MYHLDFLSSAPSIYLKSQKTGKNKVGGLFSLIFTLIMLMLLFYYLYVFFYGIEFSLIYYKDNWQTKLTNEEKEYIKKPKTFIAYIEENPKNAKITLLLSNGIDDKYTDFCNENFEIDPEGPYPCFNLSFYHLEEEAYRMLYLYCEENCIDANGNPSTIGFSIVTSNLRIDHTKGNPLSVEGLYGDHIYFATSSNQFVNYLLKFTPLLYKTTEVLNTQSSEYVETYLSDISSRITFGYSSPFAAFNLVMDTNCDIYLREYETLLDTLSKVGGLFSPVQLFFGFLVMFYSDLENNSEITKMVFFKRDKYKSKMNNNISLEKGLDIKISDENNKTSEEKENTKFDAIISDEEKIKRKKFNIKKSEQFCFCFLNCCKSNKTMKILNICNDFVENYLSAENIIFNMILFENYYKDNPIKFNENSYLNKIEREIEPDFYNENENIELKNKLNET